MLPKIIIGGVLIAGLIFFITQNWQKPSNPLSNQQNNTENSEKLLPICFRDLATDNTGDVQSQKDGSFDKTPAASSDPQLDIKEVRALRAEDEIDKSLRIALWLSQEKIFDIDGNKTNTDIILYNDSPKGDSRVVLSNHASSDGWSGKYITDNDGKSTDFTPQVTVQNNSISIKDIPTAAFADGKMNAVFLETRVYDKESKTTFFDYLINEGKDKYITCRGSAYSIKIAPKENGTKAGNYHVIVESETEDVSKQLPIKIEVSKEGKTISTATIEGDPKVICRDTKACSVDIDIPALETNSTRNIEKSQLTITGISSAGHDIANSSFWLEEIEPSK